MTFLDMIAGVGIIVADLAVVVGLVGDAELASSSTNVSFFR